MKAFPAFLLIAFPAVLSAAGASGKPQTKKELIERFRKAHDLMDVDALMDLVDEKNQPESSMDILRGRFSESVKHDLAQATLVESARRTELQLEYADAASRPAVSFALDGREGTYFIAPPSPRTAERIPIRTKTMGPQGALNDGDLLAACRSAHEDGQIEALLDLVHGDSALESTRDMIRGSLRAAAGRELRSVELHPLTMEAFSSSPQPWKPYARLKFHWNGGSPAPKLGDMLVVIKDKRRFLVVPPK